MVIIYTTTHCPYCKIAKEYLTKKGIEFEEKNVEFDEEALEEMKDKSKQLGVPVIDINGHIVVGFDRELIDDILENRL